MTIGSRRKLIAIVGDSKIEPGSLKQQLSQNIGQALVDAGHRVLTGGCGGVMEAAFIGARQSTRYVCGDTVAVLPGHDQNKANAFADIVIPTGLDHVRNSIVAHADAVVVIGGGAGTLSEVCFAWMYKRLVIALRIDGWSQKLADHPLDHRIRYPDYPDDRIFGADNEKDVTQILSQQLSRYVGQHTGIR
jgi:uncharacterized protein (TIGR00725 family)